MRRPSGLNVRFRPTDPVKVRSSSPVAAFQNFTAPSQDAICRPSGLNAIPLKAS